MAINDDRDALTQAGRHADAARAAAAVGDHVGAARLWEQIWEFSAAAAAWEAAGELGRALGAAIEGKDERLVADLHARLTATDAGAARALEVYVRHRRHGPAAELAERTGDRDRAIEHYQRAHRDLDAARLLEDAGRDREAVRLLERALELALADERAEIVLRLGRILTARAAYDVAVRYLQEATRTAAVAVEARRHLVVALAGLGLTDAARDALRRLRADDPDVTPELSEFLRAAQAARPTVIDRQREIVAGRYRLEGLLGAGSAGRVFRATDETTGRTVAVKMYFAAGARGSAAYERFVRETRIAAGLHHPALVEVLDASLDHGFLVMEYLPGGSLAQRLAAGDRPTGAQVRRLGIELLGGLELAHHRGVVHRDLKPANVFFDGRGSAKLGDFGVAHLVDLGQTQTGGLIGSLAYMAPEQITGAPITIAADLYGLGVTLFEALTGRLPFLGPDFVAQHLGEPAPAPTAVAPELAPGWDPILLGLLAKSPSDRPPSIAAVRAELETLDLGARPGSALMVPRPRRDSRPHSIAELAADEPVVEAGRYRFESPLGATAWSTLARAVDAVLDRSVVIERFEDGDVADRAIAWMTALARVGTPFVQRALAFDRATRTAVFEAPAGAPMTTTTEPVAVADGLRLLKRLARACVVIHEQGAVHGGIAATTVVVADDIPTVMVAGVGPGAGAGAGAAVDVDAVLGLAARTITGAETPEPAAALVAALGPGVDEPTRARLRGLARTTGAELYEWADALEIAQLRARR
ncbi:MAG: protein kinase [Myxococcales bacterium]|nr:protein kinase [Myxococcales bacterium]